MSAPRRRPEGKDSSLHRKSRSIRPSRALWPSILAIAIALALPGASRGDVFSWVNGKLDGLFPPDAATQPTEKERAVDAYMRRLDATADPVRRSEDRRLTSLLDRGAPAPEPDPEIALGPALPDRGPQLRDGLMALRYRPATSRTLERIESGAGRTSLLAARAGFELTGGLLENLVFGTEPLRRLLVSCQEALKSAGSASSSDRLHRAAEKVLGQVQNNHQLAQLTAVSLQSLAELVGRSNQLVQSGFARAGEAQAVPLAAASTEVLLRAKANVESSRSYVLRAQAALSSVFEIARALSSYVEGLKDASFRSHRATFTLADDPSSMDKIARALEKMRALVTRAMEGTRTAHGLIFQNRKALLELVYTLRPLAPAPPYDAAALGAMTQSFNQAGAILEEGLRAADLEVARQLRWRRTLEAYKTPSFELGVLPEWVLHRDTILIGEGGPAGLLPMPDIDAVVASLETQPADDAASELAGAVRRAASAGDATLLPSATSLPLIVEPLDGAEELPVEEIPSGPAPEASYQLPSWY